MSNLEKAKDLFLRSLALIDARNFPAAEILLQEASDLVPDRYSIAANLALVQFELHKTQEAKQNSIKLITLEPGNPVGWNNLGTVCNLEGLFEEALVHLDKAIAIQPDYADAYCNRGNALKSLKRLDDALANYDQAIALKPEYAEARNGRGIVLADLNRLEEALASYDQAIALKPDFAEAHSNRGNALADLNRIDEALASNSQAIVLKPDFAEAYSNRGNALSKLKRHDEAFAAFDKALALKPDMVGVEGARLHAKMQVCNWDNLSSEVDHLIKSINNNLVNTSPFPLLGINSSAEQLLKCASLWVQKKFPSTEPRWQGGNYEHDKIRIGYMSSDLRQHASAYLIAGIFECHDRSRFEVTGISIGPNDGSEIRQRIEGSFDKFIDAWALNSGQIEQKIREAEIDILVDLNGHTQDARPEVFARRPAPIQVNYLGYPGTFGADYIDYILADPVIAPASHQNSYSEKIAYLPNSYQANDSKRVISDRIFTREECGIADGAFVFCCFNNNYKIVPATFNSWMRILVKVPGSILWLLKDNPAAAANLKREAELRGVSAERLVFAKRVPLPDHLARHRLADLFLDTLPYNAHTTASDALWAGLPVLTQIGTAFAGRVAASLLNAIHLPELITETPDEYERLAIDLAVHPEKLAAIKHKLAEHRLSSALFDTRLFTQHIEAAYTAMYARHQAGLAPDHIVVPN